MTSWQVQRHRPHLRHGPVLQPPGGAEVQSGQGITIADTTQMIIEISVDERNARYVKTGMMVNIDQYGTPYMGGGGERVHDRLRRERRGFRSGSGDGG